MRGRRAARSIPSALGINARLADAPGGVHPENTGIHDVTDRVVGELRKAAWVARELGRLRPAPPGARPRSGTPRSPRTHGPCQRAWTQEDTGARRARGGARAGVPFAPLLAGSVGSHIRHSRYASWSPLRTGTASTVSRGDVTGKRSCTRSCTRNGDRPEGALAEHEPSLPQPRQTPAPDERGSAAALDKRLQHHVEASRA